MANKITQLVNESGDNLYPLAGGMAADSIGTEMLKDGSVTSDKIDYTTSNLPLKSGFGGTATLYRFGKLRILSLKQITGITSTDATICDLQATDAPSGTMAAIPVSGFSGNNWATFMLIVLSSSPGPRVNCHGAPGSVNAADYTLTWFV
jgi:hypothetical protein